jgi:casein kinase 1/casein kinase I family protein HRR25
MFFWSKIAEFKAYFEHVKALRFEDRPDYDYLKRLFRELFFRKGFSFDNIFDWDLLMMKSQKSRDDMAEGAADAGEELNHVVVCSIHFIKLGRS